MQLLVNSLSFAQTALIHNVITDNYPWLKATYTVWDSTGSEIRISNANDILITEGGKPREHRPGLSPYCSPPNYQTFSAIMVMDMSHTMMNPISSTDITPKYLVALAAVRNFITKINLSVSEVAIMQFDGGAELISGFTNNLDSLIKLTNASNFHARGETDFNAAFFKDKFDDSVNTALWIAKSAKYKPVIVFLTDGGHDASYAVAVHSGSEPRDGRFMVKEITDICHQRKPSVYVFAVKIGTDILDSISLGYLNNLGSIEVGIDSYNQKAKNVYLDITDADQLNDIYSYIADVCGRIGYAEPCELQWKSECTGGGELKLGFPNYKNLSASTTFSIPDDVKPALEVNPNFVTFDKNVPSGDYDTTITITAKNNFVDIYDTAFVSSDSRYKITSWGTKGNPPFTLNKDESTNITLRYSPIDSSYSTSSINIIGSECSGGNLNCQGEMNTYAADVDMGNITIYFTKNKIVKDFYCNRTGSPLLIKNIIFSGGEASSFSVFSPAFPFLLDTGKCIDVDFRFKPISVGNKSSKIKIITDSITINANIKGVGIGSPGITSPNPITFLNATCNFPTRDTTIILQNTGLVNLDIDTVKSVITGQNATEFSIVGTLPALIPSYSQASVTIRFNPKSAGSKTCILTINSNADNLPVYNIEFDATMDSTNYEPGSYLYNLGDVCIGTSIDTNIIVTNTGTKDLQINTVTKPSTINLNPASFTLNSGLKTNISINFNPISEGPIDTLLVLTDVDCNLQKTIKFTGTVYDPKIANISLNISSYINIRKDTTITITNPSTKNNLFITGITPQDSQFTFVGSVPTLPATIPPGGTMQIEISYKPIMNKGINTKLTLSGMPCHNIDMLIIGNPISPSIDIEVDKYQALIGQTIPITIKLKNADKFAESGTKSISTIISFDSTMLRQLTPIYPETFTGGTRNVILDSITVISTNNDQALTTLNLFVTDSPNLKTPITFNNSKSDLDDVIFNPVNGEFDVLIASENLQTKNYSAKPGDEVDISIYQLNGKNVSSFHESISTELKFNATLLEPIADTKSGTIINEERIIPLDNIPVDTTSTVQSSKIFRFRAMLGNAESTPLILQNSSVARGKVIFIDTVQGSFKLIGVCKDDQTGKLRLYDPTGTAQLISIKPNPASSSVELDYELSEQGNTKIWLANILGNNVLELLDGYIQPGVKSLNFSTTGLSDGVYFIIMQTPTQIFNKRLSIIK
ncbi:MAG: choice-of-anchor D domain-containing protein [FCB group bacterium]